MTVELKQEIDLDDLIDECYMVLFNYKVQWVDNFLSHGKILKAISADKETEEMIIADICCDPGEPAEFKGYPSHPPPILPKKEKIYETYFKDMHVDLEGVVRYKDIELVTQYGSVQTEVIKNGTVH